MTVRFHHLTFTHANSSAPLFHDLSLHFSRGWTGLIGPNGSGKTTLLELAAGMLKADSGSVEREGPAVFCAQRTDAPPADIHPFAEATDAEAGRLRRLLQIEADWFSRWHSLSHGERKRLQIGVALWQNPDILLIDEPTNHLDCDTLEFLQHALQSFRGTGMLVTHDRHLLDSLCTACVFLEPGGIHRYPGTYTQAREQRQRDDLAIHRERERLKSEIERLDREAKTRQHAARRADSRKSRRHLDRHDSDGRARIGLAIVTGKDGVAGKLAHQMQARIQRCQAELTGLEITPEYQLHYRLPGSISPRNHLLHLEAGNLVLGPDRTLSFPRLIMKPQDRVALVGPNGSGKSLLLSRLIPHLNVDCERLVYLPQEISLDKSRDIMRELKAQSRQQLGTIFSIISCLGSRPERLLESEQASPGEIRKVLLALGIAREPHLIIMDEPTNHLDLNAVELLEQALKGFPGALLLVSHDQRFLQSLTTSAWRLTATGTDRQLVFENQV